MDFILLFKALVLGLLEGATEFLPISSTGHLIIAEDLLDFNGETGKVFAIFIQLGAIIAVCWEYRAKIARIAHGIAQRDAASRNFALNVFIGFLPAALFGLLFHKAIKSVLFQPLTVAVALIIGAFVILWIEHRPRTPRVLSVDEIGWKDALKVGLAQSVALIPGTSRSGATIMGGLIFGLSRKAATEFSFFVAIPTMFAATLYDLFKNWQLLELADLPIFVTGFLAAFVAGFFAVRTLLSYIANHTFVLFAWYRIALGVVVLLYFW